MIRSYKAQGIVLRQQNFGEADRLLTVFTKQQGKLKLIAKGVRRLTSRKRGHLEVFTLVNLSCATGKNLDLITEAETINQYQFLRKNLNRVSIAYLFAELTDQLTAENQENNAVYFLLNEAFSKLNDTKAQKDLIINFEKKLLQALGFGLPKSLTRSSLESHIFSITEKNLNTNKLK